MVVVAAPNSPLWAFCAIKKRRIERRCGCSSSLTSDRVSFWQNAMLRFGRLTSLTRSRIIRRASRPRCLRSISVQRCHQRNEADVRILTVAALRTRWTLSLFPFVFPFVEHNRTTSRLLQRRPQEQTHPSVTRSSLRIREEVE